MARLTGPTWLNCIARRGRRLLSGRNNRAGAAISRGDAARDSQNWTEAAEAYREAVVACPHLAAIWVQLGHALKESGNLAGAESAYKTSWAIDSLCADTALQLGHAMKLGNRRADAIAWYSKAIERGHALDDPVRELLGLGLSRAAVIAIVRQGETGAAKAPQQPPPSRVYVDVTAMPSRADASSLAPAKLPWPYEALAGMHGCGFPSGPVHLGNQGFQDAQGGIATDGRLVLVDPQPKDPFAFARAMQDAALEQGLLLTLLFPDLAPLAHPEWFAVGAVHACKSRMRALAPAVGQVIVVDDVAARALRGLCVECGLTPPVISVPRPELSGCGPRAASTTPERATLPWVVLAPYDDTEQIAEQLAWRLAIDRPRRLIVAPAPDRAAGDRTVFTNAGGEVQVSALWATELIQTCGPFGALLVPESRTDADAWISAALDIGAVVIAATSSRLFRHWGAAIAEYVDWREPPSGWRERPTQSWAERLTVTDRIPPPVPPGLQATYGQAWSEAIARCLGEIKESQRAEHKRLAVGQFFTLGDIVNPGHAHGVSDGKSACVGPGWDAMSSDGVRVGAGAATLRFVVEDCLPGPYQGRLLVRNKGVEPCAMGFIDSAGERQTIVVPAGKWRWISWSGDRFGDAGQVSRVEIWRESPAAGVELVCVGLFFIASNDDQTWFAFMDQVAHGELPWLGPIET